MVRTLCILDLLQALPQCRAIFELQTLLVCSNRLIKLARSMKGSALASISLGPRRVDFDTLRDRVNCS